MSDSSKSERSQIVIRTRQASQRLTLCVGCIIGFFLLGVFAATGIPYALLNYPIKHLHLNPDLILVLPIGIPTVGLVSALSALYHSWRGRLTLTLFLAGLAAIAGAGFCALLIASVYGLSQFHGPS